jgi:hypothetical protein
MRTRNFRNKQSGQMLLVVLLVSIVGLTVGLFLVGRTTTDISLTTKITDSTRAFNAAEAGIEEAIRSSDLVQDTPIEVAEGVTYTVDLEDLGGGPIYPSSIKDPIELGQAFTVWLVPHDLITGEIIIDEALDYGHPQIYVCFTGGSPVPAMGVTVYYDAAGEIKSSYQGYDPSNRGNGFLDTLGSGDCGSDYAHRANVRFNTDFGENLVPPGHILIALRIRPIYRAASIAVIPQGGATLPTQGYDIESIGAAGETVRRIVVDEPFRVPAPFLDHAIYSTEGDLAK